ncbi:MAG: FMN-binding glutamate synthase family protein [Alphaproteobacteria bacterium]|nr:FMN-binding glutamate synthase family protein [Alphaproteobacteria bacterium]
MTSINVLASVFVFVIGLIILVGVVMFIIDVSQTADAVRRNYPVIGRFRHLFTTLGEYFRQYFFAMDREEMPFNRAERDWVYKSARGADNTIAFGSTKTLTPAGTVIFVNCPFPKLSEDNEEAPALTIGPFAENPYVAQSLVNISGMSFGAISQPAVEALSKGAAMAGCWLNTGEGGLSPYHLRGGGDIVFQIGTAKYGVRDAAGNLSDDKLREVAAHDQVKMFELKLSQGAKPGKGGILPAVKVTEEIAGIRGIPAFQDSISPNRHVDIDSVPDLLDMIVRIRDVTGKPVGFKTVVGAYGWLETLCQEVHKRGIESAPDFITVDSGDGGTGAAPMPLMDNVGLPIKESLPVVVDILTKFGLRERVKVIASGKLITPAEVAWAYCVGADFVVSARGFMFALGCIQALKCNKNTCPTGITTHDRRLQRGLDPEVKSVRVKNFVEKLNDGTSIISHSCGVSQPRALKRFHCRIATGEGKSVPLDERYPVPAVMAEYTSRDAA